MVRCRSDSDSLLGEAVKQESASLGATAVEAKCEFVEAVIEMLMLNATLERTEQPPLKQCGDLMNAWHDLASQFGAGGDHRDAVGI